MVTIVVPVVDSPAGHRALALAKERVRAEGGEVLLVGVASVTVDDRLGEHVHAVEGYLERLETELKGEGISCRSEWYVGESLGQAVLVVAREQNADLIVLGLRNRSSLGKALLGSFEHEILLEAPCPVLSLSPVMLEN
jgi:nucleotide-binding universal stress UspA family protein